MVSRPNPAVVLTLGAWLVCALPGVAWAEDPPSGPDKAVQADNPRATLRRKEDSYATAPSLALAREIAGQYEALAAAGDARDVRLAIFYYEESLARETDTWGRAGIDHRLHRLRAQLAASPTQGLQTHSTKMMAGGIVLVMLGAVSAIGGAFSMRQCGEDGICFGPVVGAGLLVHAAGCLAGGIPMVVIGAREIPRPMLKPLWVQPPVSAVPSHAPWMPVGLAVTGSF